MTEQVSVLIMVLTIGIVFWFILSYIYNSIAKLFTSIFIKSSKKKNIYNVKNNKSNVSFKFFSLIFRFVFLLIFLFSKSFTTNISIIFIKLPLSTSIKDW